MKIKTNMLLLSFALVLMNCKSEKETEMKEENNTEQESPEVNETQWKVLFDGTSTDAFRGYRQDSIYPQWSIEDGNLAFTPGGEGNKDIISKDQFTNFILSLEWKVSEGGNSGIFWGVHEDDSYPEA